MENEIAVQGAERNLVRQTVEEKVLRVAYEANNQEVLESAKEEFANSFRRLFEHYYDTKVFRHKLYAEDWQSIAASVYKRAIKTRRRLKIFFWSPVFGWLCALVGIGDKPLSYRYVDAWRMLEKAYGEDFFLREDILAKFELHNVIMKKRKTEEQSDGK